MTEILNRINHDLIPDYVPEEAVEDLRNYAYYVMKYMGYGEPTPIQYGICEALQNHSNDMILAAGRGTGKSVLTSVMASWWLLRDPNATILVTSATAQKAIDFMSMTRQILAVVPFMNHLLPGDDDIDNALAFNSGARVQVGQDKSISAAGIMSQIVGKHADYIIGDDLEVRGNCDTQEARDKLLGRIHEFESIRNKGGRVVFLGTPHTRDSNYNKLATTGYPFVKFPAEFPDPTIPSRVENIAPWITERMDELDADPGDATQPERFDKEMLMGRYAKIGPANYALQFLLDTSLADDEKYPLKLQNIVCTDVGLDMFHQKVQHARSTSVDFATFGMAGDKAYKPMYRSEELEDYLVTTLHVDPSGRGSDETGLCVASATPTGYICIHEMIGIPGGYDDETLHTIAQLAYRYKCKLIRYESNFGDGMFGSLLQPVVKRVCGQVGVEEFRVQGQKERRLLDTLEPVIATQRLVMDPRALKDKTNQLQITRLTDQRGALKHDDRVDALAHAVSYYTDMLGVDVDAVIAANEAKAVKEEQKMWADDDRRSAMIIETCTSGAARRDTPTYKPVRKGRLMSWGNMKKGGL